MISGRSRVSPDVGRRGTDGTILDHTHLPLLTWFWATYLMVTRPGLNASTLGTQLGMSSRKNIHATLTRLRAAMAAYDPPQLGGVVEADKMVVGGYGAGA
ncbi:MAG: hypothetical protein LH650_14205, partial [Chloroflexi bacterium]|nr:hypothetical protein [Chloroflexota bacterium]